jgi:tetratricopeptide (TPR) repeat protein
MGTVTYPHAEVAAFVTERFVPIKFNITEHHPDFKEALGRGKVLWGPLLVFLDGRGSELRRYVGFLPPEEFLAELRLVLGFAAMIPGKIDEALSWFAAASDAYPNANAAPEALYWAAAAAYRTGGLAAVIRRWDNLIARYPDSTWARRADVIPTEVRAKVEAGG